MKEKHMIVYIFEPEKRRSAAYDQGKRIGLCEYKEEIDVWTITHTETDPAYGGRGIARKLVLLVDEAARENGKTVVPVCSYAVKVLQNM